MVPRSEARVTTSGPKPSTRGTARDARGRQQPSARDSSDDAEPRARRRRSVGSGTRWEALASYARAVRAGDHIWVSGTTASGPEGPVGGDAGAQARFVFDKIETALGQLGATLRDVVRTRVFVRSIDDWEAVARAHGERFRGIDPANTLVEAKLVDPALLVEIEAEAIAGSGRAR